MVKEKVFLHNLGKEICEARKRMKMSQAELAEKADISVTYLSKIECGYRNFSVYTLAKISQALSLHQFRWIRQACDEEVNISYEEFTELLRGYSYDEIKDILQIIRTVNGLIAKRSA
jgi:transcriptional regulator with XRE-family HTH domain